ncbi:tetratricopeptide repeat protein [Chitinilyticum aquatile]|uniref:tetratricopeptide repeat protein n=1 Tax=Chitinilyticum aquatile TaxID=362520 RepID=UPI0004063427|nr:tetratricopeptide repeat protein [Chitinilyticum aquatile]
MMTLPSPEHAARLRAIDEILFVQPAEARDLCVRLLGTARSDPACFIQAALKLSYIEDQMGETGLALTMLEEALGLVGEPGLASYEASLLEQIGRCNYTRGLYTQALAAWERSLRLSEARSDLLLCQVQSLMGLGQICDAFGQFARAAELHRLADGLVGQVRDPYLAAAIKINLATNLIRLSEFAEAQWLLDESLGICREYHFPHHEAETLMRQAELAMHAHNDLDEAQNLLEMALEVLVDTPYHWGEVNILGSLAEIQFRRRQHAQALETAQRALLVARSDGLRQLEARLTAQASMYAHLTGNSELAEMYRQRSSLLQGRIEQEARQNQLLMQADRLGHEFVFRNAAVAASPAAAAEK